jgi:hypothetical protein
MFDAFVYLSCVLPDDDERDLALVGRFLRPSRGVVHAVDLERAQLDLQRLPHPFEHRAVDFIHYFHCIVVRKLRRYPHRDAAWTVKLLVMPEHHGFLSYFERRIAGPYFHELHWR